MLGYDDPNDSDTLLHPLDQKRSFRSRVGANCLAASAITFLVLVPTAIFSAPFVFSRLTAELPDATPAAEKATVAADGSAPKWHGVSLGGWLVMEINPSKLPAKPPPDMRPYWMFDQFEARSELDFVLELRAAKGDDYTIATMKNHWSHYYTDEMLDKAMTLGINAVRIPVGYWIMDAPDGGSSPLEYGFSPEGFVTGGLNHLREMLIKLKKRGMKALVDLHAHPCNSACVSNGLSCAGPLAFTPEGGVQFYEEFLHPEIKLDLAKCGGGVYKTTRVTGPGMEMWGDVGVKAVNDLAKWLSELPEEAKSVAAFQLANEPALGPPGIFDEQVNIFYDKALKAARSHLKTLPLAISYMGPRPSVIDFFKTTAAKDAAGGELWGDHHYYLNWQSPPEEPFPWSEIHRRACVLEAEASAHDVDVYVAFNQKLIVGEWSLASNHDLQRDLSDPAELRELNRFFREQLATFATKQSVVATFFWSLRMGSGWDPRPSDAFPNGRQLEGSSAESSLKEYPFKVWSLLEMATYGVVTSFDKDYSGACGNH
jgi:hypothetical protein